jgi:transposase
MKISRVGVDLAKNIFQLHGVDRHGKTVLKRWLSREKWIGVLIKSAEPGGEIGMEACGGARYRRQRKFQHTGAGAIKSPAGERAGTAVRGCKR